MNKIIFFAIVACAICFVAACGDAKREQRTENESGGAVKPSLEMLQGDWETGNPDDPENYAVRTIKGDECMSDMNAEYGADRISFSGDTIIYTNSTLAADGIEPVKNIIVKLTEDEFVEKTADGIVTVWRKKKN